MTTYRADPDGLHVFVDGACVAVIPAAQFGALVYALLAVMRRP